MIWNADIGFIAIILAIGVSWFLVSAGQALKAAASRPRPPKHQHTWKTISEVPVFEDAKGTRAISAVFTLRCEGCGEITSRSVRP